MTVLGGDGLIPCGGAFSLVGNDGLIVSCDETLLTVLGGDGLIPCGGAFSLVGNDGLIVSCDKTLLTVLGGDGLIPCGGAFSLAGDGLFSFDSTTGLLVLTATLATFTKVCLSAAPTVESLSSLTDLLGGLAPVPTSF